MRESPFFFFFFFFRAGLQIRLAQRLTDGHRPRGSRKASQMESRPDAPQAPSSHRSYGFSESPYAPACVLERSTSLPEFAYGHTPDSGTSMRAPSVGDYVQTRSPHGPKKRRLSQTSAGWNESSKRSMRSSVEALPVPSSTDYTELLMDLKGSTRDDPLAQEWNADPYEVDPELTIHHVECYLTHVNDSLYPIFPRRRFLLWLKSCRTKSLDDKMLLYWMMTMGCVFSDRSDRLGDMKRYSRAARYAVEHSPNTLSLQLAQSRIIMGIWYFAIGETAKSWDAVGAAVRVVFGLRYNVEFGGVIMDQSQSQPSEYGLHRQALIECRRRTFWAAFLLDVSIHVRLLWESVLMEANLAVFEFLFTFFYDLDSRANGLLTPALSGKRLRGTAIRDGALLPAVSQQSTADRGGSCSLESDGILGRHHVSLERCGGRDISALAHPLRCIRAYIRRVLHIDHPAL